MLNPVINKPINVENLNVEGLGMILRYLLKPNPRYLFDPKFPAYTRTSLDNHIKLYENLRDS